MNATTVEYVGGIEVIKAFNQSAASYEKIHRRCPTEHAAHAGMDEIDARLFCVDDDILAGCSDRCASCGVSALSEWQPFSVGFYYHRDPFQLGIIGAVWSLPFS